MAILFWNHTAIYSHLPFQLHHVLHHHVLSDQEYAQTKQTK